ncbi:progranulin [Larus michahellis]|uniref:progranulin n=1 Tax=Larus michahellis TaxID=119627 RepID=UPI003D9AD5F4
MGDGGRGLRLAGAAALAGGPGAGQGRDPERVRPGGGHREHWEYWEHWEPRRQVLPASSVALCQDGTPCPAVASCPLPEGVLCASGHHCCPRGSRCSADGESCIAAPAPRAVPCPDGQSECPDDATCCVTATGAWGCCPMPQASCCADKVHCCPHATLCDLAHGRCLSPAGDIPLATKFPAWKRQPPASVALRQVLCPDGRSACPDGATCCQLSSTQYGCCPLQNAVCCGDRRHCCPQGTTCDLERSTCTSARPLPALPKASDVRCDEETSCPDGNTCCRLSSGAWGCCPLEQAVCCPDHVHCCPQGYTCDPAGGSCLQEGGGRRPWLQKSPALARGGAVVARGGDVRCDEETSCPDGNTCCQLSSGAWGCCPLEQAVCCPDHVHCCPQGYTCDPAGGSCLQEGGGRRPWLQKSPALARGGAVVARGGDVRCDEETSCPDGNTCCQLSLGTWGCCPLEQAVCCPDHVHCCPQGYTCDPAGGSCLQEGGGRRPWLQKSPALARGGAVVARGGDVRCDEETSCPDGNTCCQLSSGAWGCCPLEQAVCCPDHVHCCPQGYTCDPAGGSCLQEGGGRRPWLQKSPALARGGAVVARGGDVRCDEETSCPDGNTCCQLSLGTWGCCPLEQAVCCPDHVHCCPQGYTCDPAGGSCLQEGGGRRPWLQKSPALARGGAVVARGGDVRCDEETSCPDGNTCCQLSSGAWGCCPLEQAVCCPDHVHCCPQGYTCDPAGGSCLQEGGGRRPWLQKSPALARGGAVVARGGDVRCDEETSCPDGNTCCQLSSGAWGCCPLEQAVCCPDHVHCCPQGYTCDPAGGSCLQEGGGRRPWLQKSPALARGGAVVARGGDVRCDEETSCPDGNTCCQLSLGTWGCCPLEQAVCCRDHQHCCPRGYTCNVAAQSCEKLLAPTPLLPAPAPPLRLPAPPHHPPNPPPALLRATSTQPGATVPCDAANSCRLGQRCCRSRGGSWGCCPFTQGSCCSDGRHCCPGGSRCSRGGQGCSPQRWDLPAPRRVLL